VDHASVFFELLVDDSECIGQGTDINILLKGPAFKAQFYLFQEFPLDLVTTVGPGDEPTQRFLHLVDWTGCFVTVKELPALHFVAHWCPSLFHTLTGRKDIAEVSFRK
jgi:hypothetical protein